MSNPGQQDLLRSRAINLFTFLRDVIQTRTKVVRSLENYTSVVWFGEVPREPECGCIAWTAPDDNQESEAPPWLRVQRPEIVSPPAVPAEVMPWVKRSELADSSIEAPSLFERILDSEVVESGYDDENEAELTDADDEMPEEDNAAEEPEEEGPTFVQLADHPEVVAQWQAYRDQQWQPWAERDRRKRQVKDIYTKLYSLYQQQKQLGETSELVLGLGHLRWTTPSGQEVSRHLICAQVNVEFDAARGEIIVDAAVDGARPRLEQDMLEPAERIDTDLQKALERDIASVAEDLWHNEQLLVSLKSYVHALGERGDGAFAERLERVATADEAPTVHLAPALILRPRPERGLLQMYEQILEDLHERETVPPGLRPLIEVEGGRDTSEPDADGAPGAKPSERSNRGADDLYFPLPANDEQRDIIHRLAHARGVLVQGPPGTGKSHTIANLISHLLATGNRVLVTSQTPRSLRVLKDKIPRALADLCVVLLGHDQTAFDELEGSVKGITDQLNNWDQRIEAQRIEELENKLDAQRRAVAKTDAELRSIREAETYAHPPRDGGYAGTLQQIAQQIHAAEPEHGWLKPFAGTASLGDEAGLSEEEALELLGLLRKLTPELECEAQQHVPKLDALIDEGEFAATTRSESEATEELKRLTPASGSAEIRSAELDDQPLRELRELLEQVVADSESLEKHAFDWTAKLASDTRADQGRPWHVLLEETRDRLEAVRNVPDHLRDIMASGLGDIDVASVREDAKLLKEHLQRGGKLKRWFRYVPVVRERRYLVENARIGGKECRTVDALNTLERWCDAQFQLRALDKLWEDVTATPQGAPPKRLAAFEDFCKPIEAALRMHEAIEHANQLLRQQAGLAEPTWQDLESVQTLLTQARRLECQRKLHTAGERLNHLLISVRHGISVEQAHPTVSALSQAIEDRDPEAYRRQLEALDHVLALRQQVSRRDVLLRTARTWLPGLATSLREAPQAPEWEIRLTKLEAAWNWLKTERWLAKQVDPTHFETLLTQRHRLQEEIGELTESLAAAKAWKHSLTRMSETPKLETYLKAWTQAASKITRTASKQSTKYRAVARDHMAHCTAAVPAWIMPLHRLVETVRPGEDLFDVVIVDEASQSGMEAMFLNYLGAKLIVVGDDKQIAPDYVGTNKDDVELLRQKHIPDLPLSPHFDLDNSFFDHAHMRYSSRLRLREHFRCMPEIIQFSNNLSYANEPLIPLRQYGEDRLNPVVTTYVEDGYVKGRRNVVNPAEADAIVEQIARCCENPDYADRTFGVISLQGEDQAVEIEKALMQRIGPEEMERRNIVCGDAYAFQGDERHVMFLSLVRAPSDQHSFRSLAGLQYERRFNVAASRAQDQLWLFHSVTLDDLRPNDLRYRLLEYCLNPAVHQDRVADLSIPDLEQLARSADRSVKPPSPFDSWFEVDVFLQIHRRGYRVQPQHEIAGYRIDLVVSGLHGRLAVECDGERWHGPDTYDRDMARQRQLERCGWRFWRIRGGAYYRDSEAALEPLWELLGRTGIHSLSSGESSSQAHDVSPDGDAVGATPNVDVDRAGGAVADTNVRHDCDSNAVHHPTPSTKSLADGNGTDRTALQQVTFELKQDSADQIGLFEGDNDSTTIPCPDPRTAAPRQVREALVAIVREHGPLPCHYAYRLYVRTSGINLGKNIKRALNRAMAAAVRAEVLEQANEYNTRDQANQIVRTAGTPAVILRPRGERNLEDIPPSELAAMMQQIASSSGSGQMPKEDLFREVLNRYELTKLTQKAQSILEVAWVVREQDTAKEMTD